MLEDSQVASTSTDGPIPHALEYSVAAASSSSGPYWPEKILEDRPHDSSSRWSTRVGNPSDAWILLKLKNPSVLSSISFGKYYKAHPCNLCRFKLFTGPSVEELELVIEDDLKNDNVPETFIFAEHKDDLFKAEKPSQFLKIVPLSAQMPKYNASIWHLVIRGFDEPAFIRTLGQSLQNRREREAMRLVLKFLRQRGLEHVLAPTLASSGIWLEDPLVSRLFVAVVHHMDYKAAECILREIGGRSGFSAYLDRCIPHARWQPLESQQDVDGKAADAPSARGGHTMCLDDERRLIYLLGGWDGERALPDFWSYNINSNHWHPISLHTQADGGPGARFGHAMVLDQRTKSLFVLGRCVHLKRATRPSADDDLAHDAEKYPSDFFRYRSVGRKEGLWEQLSYDTQVEGGPRLLHGHRMVVDGDFQKLYVFGGEVITGERHKTYSGLYCYDMAALKWSMIFDDRLRGGPIPSRKGHSMLYVQNERAIYIFGGTRDGAVLTDMWSYSLLSNKATLLQETLPQFGDTFSGLCQQSIYDEHAKEIRLFVDYGRPRHPLFLGENVGCWIFQIPPGTWNALTTEDEDQTTPPDVHEPKHTGQHPGLSAGHDIVFDPTSKSHFLFGRDLVHDNGADSLWLMTLQRPSIDEAIRRCQFLLRKQSFTELCRTSDSQAALGFLKETVSVVVDHGDPEGASEYHSLMEYILRPDDSASDELFDPDSMEIEVRHRQRDHPIYQRPEDVDEVVFHQRMKLFELLLQFIDPSMKQPDADLMDRLF